MPKKTADPLDAALQRQAPRREPLWRGPEEDGVTQSLLSKFLVCRERFRLLVVEGLRAQERFPHRLEYGNMWHACEEGLAAQSAATAKNYTGWRVKLNDYTRALMLRYPMEREAVMHWSRVCAVQFLEYVKYWAEHPDNQKRAPLLQEQVFSVPYKLPSGRAVRLRGKWDSVDLIGEGKEAGVWLQENKTKGDVDERQLKRQLKFDLQTMFYLVALYAWNDDGEGCNRLGEAFERCADSADPVRGVRYNVIRRPLSGGKGTIKRHEPTKKNPLGESQEAFYERLRRDCIAADPAHYFMRWQVTVIAEDVARFRRECLDPALEQLCDWWEWVSTGDVWRREWLEDIGIERESKGRVSGTVLRASPVHFRMPFGVYSPLLDGGATELDEFLDTGSMVGLTRTENLYPELAEIPA